MQARIISLVVTGSQMRGKTSSRRRMAPGDLCLIFTDGQEDITTRREGIQMISRKYRLEKTLFSRRISSAIFQVLGSIFVTSIG